MNAFMKFIFYIGFIFFGGGFVIALGQFVIYNGIGNIFEYVKADNAIIDYKTSFSNKIEITNIEYEYSVENEPYNSKESISSSAIEKKNIKIDSVFYNKTSPSFSYIGDNNLSLRKAKSGMMIMGFFLFL